MTPERAREKWSRETGLPVDMAPRFPSGCREYADYHERLTAELDKLGKGDVS